MKKIALITWWNNKEREISLISAKYMLDNIDSEKYEVDYFDFPNDKQNFLNNYSKYDLVFPLIHWVWGEDWEITAFLEFVWKKYLFSSSLSHKLCLNKDLSWIIAKSKWFLTPETFLIKDISDIEKLDINYKIFVKPCNWGSSVDNWVFENISEAHDFIKNILTYDTVLVQEFIKKQREFSVTIVGDYDKNPQVFAISEVISQKEIFDYDAKYKSDWAIEVIHAKVDDELKQNISQMCLWIYKLFELKTFSRVDILYNDWKIYFLEVNTIPGVTPMSFVPQAIISNWKTIKEFLNECFESVF